MTSDFLVYNAWFKDTYDLVLMNGKRIRHLSTKWAWSRTRSSPQATGRADAASLDAPVQFCGQQYRNSVYPVFLLAIISCIQFPSCEAIVGWTGYNLEGISTAKLRDSVFYDRLHGWAVGDGDTLIYTENMGQSWLQTSTGFGYSGLNWHGIAWPQRCTNLPSVEPGQVDRTCDYSRGFLVGNFASMARTVDNGATWNQIQRSQFGFPNSDMGARIGDLTIRAVSGLDGTDLLWAVGDEGLILHTVNGGDYWVQQLTNVLQTLYDVNFYTNSTGYAVGAFGTILRTSNGGATWTRQTSGLEGSTLNLYSVKAFPSTGPFQDELLAAVVGDRGTMMITTDMGEYWKPKPSCTTRQLNDVHFRYLPKTESDGRVSIDIGNMYVSGEDGLFCQSTDLAKTWAIIDVGALLALNSVAGVLDDEPFVFGDNGLI
eukprot:CAMPEP_0114239384 /NCGR_PEP_ID=MMETSP0058-20121206/8430_1 /TAXON_ID=36894 /ORGANISM="Pyramimonas parkeae, CCMP726" /LENGTH=428 /DNA_ID=CAMNT_0001351559 /DNA_START=327 /DNA_END=1610 /DNA_ORIENTATION=+